MTITAAHVGHKCAVEGYGSGVIRFVGKHHETDKKRVGVELAESVGKHNGTVKGEKMFVVT